MHARLLGQKAEFEEHCKLNPTWKNPHGGLWVYKKKTYRKKTRTRQNKKMRRLWVKELTVFFSEQKIKISGNVLVQLS